ncbi:MAG: hypothetical protein FVQ82_05980 [Planctomycetes bacterium]|nr:hypothetical protein [Planctomycetota bacterium]
MNETEEKVSSDDVKTVEKTYSEEQFKGLLCDKQAEVKKRQTIETELAELKAKQTQDPPSGKNEGSIDGEDAPMTVGQFKSMLAEQKETDANAVFAALEAETSAIAKQKMTAETHGEGLDFDSVIAAGGGNLSEGDKLAIRQSKDPASEKYRRCIFNTPELSEKSEAVRTSKLLENIKLNGRVPGTGGVATTANADSVSEMSEEELDKLAASLD